MIGKIHWPPQVTQIMLLGLCWKTSHSKHWTCHKKKAINFIVKLTKFNQGELGGWLGVLMDGWVDGWTDGHDNKPGTVDDGWMCGLLVEWKKEWMEGWLDMLITWTYGWMDRQRDRWMEFRTLTSALERSLQLALICFPLFTVCQDGISLSDWECDSVLDGLLCWESCDPSWPITPLSVLKELTLLQFLRTLRGLSMMSSNFLGIWNLKRNGFMLI